MPGLKGPADLVCFEGFQLDLRAGELRQNGGKIVRLPEQPFQILAILLQHPGEVVTRDEIRKCLWPDDTIVEFEHSISAAMNRLREALGDSAESPRFIETLPRRGYRFIAPVEGALPASAVDSTDHLAPAVTQEVTHLALEKPAAEVPAPSEARTQRRTVWLAFIACAFLVVLLVGFNAGGLRQRFFGRPDPIGIRSLAVLPLENLSHDPEQEYFADGMTEALTTELAQIGTLKVISRTSVMQYKGTKKPLPQIAKELGVDAVVEGAVQRSGDKVGITFQLIQAPTDRHLLAKSYERDLREVLALQREVAHTIADEIKAKLTQPEKVHLASARSIDSAAYEDYLKGRYFWNKRTVEGFKKALKYFDEAIARDPNYALAYVGVADSYTMLADYDWLPPLEAAARAKTAVTRALEIDDKLAEAHTSLADIKRFYDWDWVGAEREYKRAIELNPNYGTAHQWYAEYLSGMGRPQQAIREMERAQELDPLSVVVKSANGWVLLFAREYNQAIAQCQKVIELDPSFGEVYSQLRRAYEQKGMYTEALAADEKFRVFKSKGADRRRRLSQPIAISGAKAYWQKMHEVTEEDLRNNVEAARFRMAEIYAQLGQKDQALRWLERAYQEHSFWMPFLKVHPHLDPLRSDPRFQDLLRRMNLPQ